MATKPLTYKIGADIGDLRRKMEEAGTLTRDAQKELRKMQTQQREHRAAMSDLGASMLGFGAAAVLGLGMAAREAIRWESAFAGVRKTVDGSDAEIAALEGELRQLARTLPATHQEIAAVAEAAGQLGIKRQDIAEFTKTMVDLGETTNLTAEQAAEALAKFMNIMGTSASDVDKLGSALVALGNDGASTEADIIAMGLRIAGAGRQIGLTESQVLAFASSLSSVGIEAEAGGSSFSRVMVDMQKSITAGGEKLDTFAKVAGMSTQEFAAAFKKDASGAISAFITGLGQMQASGQDVFGVLGQLELTEIRVQDAMLRAAGAAGLFTNSLKTGSDAWAENTALADEAAKRYDTTEAQMAMASNAIKDAAIDIGSALLPIIQGGVEGIRNLITWWQNLPGPIQTAVTVLGVATAAVTVLGGAALIAAPKILAFRASMTNMIATGGGMAGAMGKFGRFMVGPWGLGIGLAITLLGAFGIASGGAQQRQEELLETGKRVAEAIAEQNGVMNQSVRQATATALADKGLLQVAKDLGIALPDVTDAVLDQGGAYDDLKGKLEGVIAAKQAELDAENAIENQSGVVSKKVEALETEIGKYQELLDGINGVRDGKTEEQQAQEAAAEGSEKGAAAAEKNAKSTEEMAASAEKAAEAFDALFEALDRLNGTTLNHRAAQRALIEAVNDANGVFAENGVTLDRNTEAGLANEEALDGVADAMNAAAEAAAHEAETTGGVTAGNAALIASLQSSREQLFQMARRFFGTAEEAWAYVDSVLAIPPEAATEILTPGSETAKLELQRVKEAVVNIPPDKEVNVGVLSQAAIAALNAIGVKVTTLPDGTVVVNAQTAAAQAALTSLANENKNRTFWWQVKITRDTRVMDQYGMTSAYGNIVQFAGGGMSGGESHQPMVAHARPGTVRVWAEPETHKESYIPWAPDRRGRATSILGVTADAFGYQLVPKSQRVQSYANGGISGGYAGGAAMLAGCTVQVFVGDRELTDIVDVRITENNRQTRRNITSGSGNTR